MARFERVEVINQIRETACVPIFYNPDIKTCIEVLKACNKGGLRLFEFTNRGDFAHEVYSELHKFAQNEFPDMILGVGSVIDGPTAALYMQLGANFVVSPLLENETARICNRRKVLWIPGCGSVSEISLAEELGAEIVKIFPGTAVGGPGFVRSLKGPMPWSSVMPTSGIEPTEESIKSWFSAGIVAAGLGSQLFTKEIIEGKRYDELTVKIQQVLGWIGKYRKQ